jgi:hypothetical protein
MPEEGKWIKLSDVVDTTETRKLQETTCNGFLSDENTIKSVDVAWLQGSTLPKGWSVSGHPRLALALGSIHSLARLPD